MAGPVVEICGMVLTGVGAVLFAHGRKPAGAALAILGVPAFFVGIGMIIGAAS